MRRRWRTDVTAWPTSNLMHNETALASNLSNSGNQAYQSDISSVLWKYSTTSTYSVGDGLVIDPVTGIKATTNDNASDENICWVLLNRLLQVVPERFSDIGSVIDSSGVFPVPISQGDSINFTFTINPAESKHELTDASEVLPRKRQVKLIVDDSSGANTTPFDGPQCVSTLL